MEQSLRGGDSEIGGNVMRSMKLWLLLGSIGFGTASFGCSGAGDTNGLNPEDKTPAKAEQKYTPSGRIIALHQRATIARLNNWGSGDSDIYTQKGRLYTVNAWADKGYYVPGSGKVTTTIHYSAYENYPDYTYLYNDQQVTFYVSDTAYRINNIVNSGTFLDLSERCPYNNCQYEHYWTAGATPPGQEEQAPTIQQIWYYYDGLGPDDNGNANATFDLYIYLDVTDY
jgi:hypothetical protein